MPGGRSGLGWAAAGCAWLSRAPGAQHACPSFLQIQRVSGSGRRARRTGGALVPPGLDGWLCSGKARSRSGRGSRTWRALRIRQRCPQPTRDGAGGADRFPFTPPGRLQTNPGDRLPFWPLRGCMNPETSQGAIPGPKFPALALGSKLWASSNSLGLTPGHSESQRLPRRQPRAPGQESRSSRGLQLCSGQRKHSPPQEERRRGLGVFPQHWPGPHRKGVDWGLGRTVPCLGSLFLPSPVELPWKGQVSTQWVPNSAPHSPYPESQYAEAHRLSAAWWSFPLPKGRQISRLTGHLPAGVQILRNEITQKKTETQDRVRGACPWMVLVCAVSETWFFPSPGL